MRLIKQQLISDFAMISFRKTIELARNRPVSFCSIIALQLLFFIALAILLFSYSQSIVEPLQNINDELMSQRWMNETPTTEKLQELNIPATDVKLIDDETHRMEVLTIKLYASIIALVMVLGSLIAALSYRITLGHPWKKIRGHMLRFSAVVFFGLSTLFLLVHSAIILFVKQFFTPNASQTYLFMLPLFVAAMLLYFVPIAFAIIPHTQLKDIVQKAFHAGIRKCAFLFSFYAIVTLVLSALLIGIIKAAGVSFVLAFFLGMIFLMGIAFARIVLIAELEEKI
jgi:hypothetical protein